MTEDMQGALSASRAREESLASALRLIVTWCEDDRELYGSVARRLWLVTDTARRALAAHGEETSDGPA